MREGRHFKQGGGNDVKGREISKESGRVKRGKKTVKSQGESKKERQWYYRAGGFYLSTFDFF